jgi:hypothetical protein
MSEKIDNKTGYLGNENRGRVGSASGSMKNALTGKIVAEYLLLRTSYSKLDHHIEEGFFKK